MKKFENVILEKKKSLEEFVDKTKEKTVSLIDQNDDGKLDLEDVNTVVNAMADVTSKTVDSIKETTAEKTRLYLLNTLKPIFLDDLDSADFSMTKFIHITEKDKKYQETDVCKGSIGYRSEQKGFKYINIFLKNIENFGITLYPDECSEFYLMDPTDRDRYIALDEYFGYLKIERINELQKIAQDLGAKHFKVVFKEEQVSFSNEKSNAKVKLFATKKKNASANMEQAKEEKKFSKVDIAAEMTFPGHPPVKPTLKYLQKDSSIQNLIALRLDESSPVQNHRLTINLSNTLGIKEKDAVSIDGVLSTLKCSGNATVASETKNESRRYLEYEIDF